MLTELRLENFKCFGTEVVIPTGGLTLLTGINAKGKSTVLHALLVLHQSITRALAGGRIFSTIDLNGHYVHLGTFREIQNRDRPKGEPVQIGLEFTANDEITTDIITTNTRLLLQQDKDEERWADVVRVEVEKLRNGEVEFQRDRERRAEGLPFVMLDFREREDAPRDQLALSSGLAELGRVHYVSADRFGPQDFFAWSDEEDFLSVGVRGERTAEVLYQAERRQQRVEESDRRAREGSETLLVTDQTSAWLSYVFDGGKMRVVAPHSTILTMEMNADGSAHYHRPANVGFGYSYVLPILVAGLVAQPGEMLIVENPEAHLHPLAQSRLGEFLATVSAAGVQVFVESHSEHILNAFRLAVKEHWIDNDALSVLYFRRDNVDPILRIEVEADGRISHWPDGFFDQRTQDFFRLFGNK